MIKRGKMTAEIALSEFEDYLKRRKVVLTEAQKSFASEIVKCALAENHTQFMTARLTGKTFLLNLVEDFCKEDFGRIILKP